jgi:hypothetical protein
MMATDRAHLLRACSVHRPPRMNCERKGRTRISIQPLLMAALVACAPQEAEPAAEAVVRTPDGVEYAARTALLASYPVRLRTTAVARNRGSGDVVLRFPDDCPLLVRVLTRGGDLRWDQGRDRTCAPSGEEVRLAAGDSVRFETYLSAPEILGDSLPDDVYLLVAYLRPAHHPPVFLEAGRANRVVPR